MLTASQRQAMEQKDQAVLALLEKAAEEGRKCPTNNDICFAVGAMSPSSGPAVLSRLEKAGLIKVYPGQCSRVVEIVGTGKRTAGQIPKPHWRERPENRHRKHKQYRAPIKPHEAPAQSPPTSTARVDRDPCQFCGVRSDVGCRHRVAA